jgi:tetratricopeptide (TPR) repeat protein
VDDETPEEWKRSFAICEEVINLTIENRHDDAVALLVREREESRRAGNNREIAYLSQELARVFGELKRDDDAVAAYRCAEAAMPDEADYKTILAEELVRLNRADEALAKATEAVDQTRSDPGRRFSACGVLGEALLALGRDAEAVEAFRQLASPDLIEVTKHVPAYGFNLRFASALMQRGLVVEEVRPYVEMIAAKALEEDNAMTAGEAQKILDDVAIPGS